MFQSLFLAMSFFISTEALAHSSSSNYSQQALNSVKPYVVIMGPEALTTVRVNIENYEPNNKEIKKSEISFGDGVNVINKKDVFHKYLTSGVYTILVKTWNGQNQLTTYTQSVDVSASYQVIDLINTSVLGPITINNEQKYRLDLTPNQAQSLYKLTLIKNSNMSTPPHYINKRCGREFNIEINNIDIFNDHEINCQTTKLEKFVLLNTKNILKLEAHAPRWRNAFKVEIHAVDILKNLDTTLPIITSNTVSNSLTNHNLVHISVAESSSVTTYVWNGQQQLINTLTSKEFDLVLAEGQNSFVLKSVDAAGNSSTYLYLNHITLDTTLPEISLQLNSEYIFSSYPQNFDLIITSNEDLQSLTINNKSALMLTPRSFSYILNVAAPEALTLNIKAFDLAGNEALQTKNISFGIDNLAPVLSANVNSNTYTNQNSITIIVADNSNATTKVYKENVLILTTQLKTFNLNLTNGGNEFIITSIDQYGNVALPLELTQIVYDNILPLITTNIEPNYLFQSLPQNVNLLFTANESLLSAEVNGVAVTPQNNVISHDFLATNTNNNTINLKVTDLAGNTSTLNYTVNIDLDNIKPQLSILNAASLTNQNSINLGFNVIDANSAKTYIKFNGEDLTSINEKNFSYVFDLVEGVNTIGAYSTDIAGNVSEIVTKQVTKDTAAPELINITPLTGTITDQLIINVSGVSNEKLQKVLINGQLAVISNTETEFSNQLVFADYGTKLINIQATDLAGNTTNEQLSIELKALSAPLITTNLSNGYMTFDLISVNVTGDNLTNLKILINDVEYLNENASSYNIQFPYGQGVAHNIEIFATNSAGLEAHSSYVSTLDSVAPFINLSNVTTQTTLDLINIGYSFYDLSPTVFRVLVDNQMIFETTDVAGNLDIPLVTNGTHTVTATAIDAAGNMSEPFIFEINKDNTAPVLTIVTPANNDYVDATGFKVKLTSDDKLSSLTVNGQTAVWNDSEQLYEITLTSFNTETFEVKAIAVNELGMVTEKFINVRPLLSPFEKNLLGLFEDGVNNKIIVKGAEGFTRPFLWVKVKSGVFSVENVQADKNGSFMLPLEKRDDYLISVVDPLTGTEHEHRIYLYRQEVILSGKIKDENNQPVVGVKLNLGEDNLETYTDAAGVFSFNNADFTDYRITGNQVLIIDARQVVSVGARTKNFSVTKMNVNISLKRNNIIQDTIYIYPTYSDSVNLNAVGGGVITSPEASGVVLNVPSEVTAIFPSGTAVEPIQMFTVSPDKLTVKPPDEVMPSHVLVLEPSGTVFTDSVDLTMPNYSNFPPRTDMVLVLYNSQKGIWEIGAAGEVTSDGQSVVSKPNQGIRHFSAGFYIPLPPDSISTNVPDRIGSDSFSGAVTNKIEMPSFKVMGQNVSPALVYKSTWAKPSTTISNVLNFADSIVTLANNPDTETGEILSGYAVDIIKCENGVIKNFLLDAFFPYGPMLKNANKVLDPAGYSRHVEAVKRDMERDHLLPENCWVDDKQQFYKNYNYERIFTDFKESRKPQKVEMQISSSFIPNVVRTFTQFPNAMSQLSQYYQLKNSNNEYLASGIYTYIAHYKIFYDQLITGNVKTKYYDKITGTTEEVTEAININSLAKDNASQFFGQDLVDNIFVQNYTNSTAGQGWRVAGVQKIINPNAQQIMLEEADGGIATYSVKNSIKTVVDFNQISGDVTSGVSLNMWPTIAYTDANSNEVKRINTNQLGLLPVLIGKQPTVSGSITGYTYYNWAAQGEQHVIHECKTRIYFPGGNACVEYYPDTYYYDVLPRSTCKINTYPFEQASSAVQYLSTADGGVYLIDDKRHSLGYLSNNNYTDVLANKVDVPNLISGTSRLQNANDPFSIQVIFDNVNVENYSNSRKGVTLGDKSVVRNDSYESTNACGSANQILPKSQGFIYEPSSNSLGQPSNIIVSNDPSILLIADASYNQIYSYNIATREKIIIAGIGSQADAGNNITAIKASLFSPRGIAQDATGNLYISTDLGHIRKVDTNGTMTTIVGDGLSGSYKSEGEGLTMNLSKPYGLAVDSVANVLYVADTGHNRILKVDLSDNYTTAIAGTGQAGFSGDGAAAIEAQFSLPTFIHLDQNNNLIVVDAGNNKIRSISLENANNTELAYAPTTPDNSKLIKKTDGSFERIYRNGQKEIFNALGVHISSVAKNNLTTSYNYNSNNEIAEVVFPNQDKIEYVYAQNKISVIRDPAGRETAFSYNGLNQLVQVTYPDSTHKSFSYSADGLMLEERNQKNFVASYTYNNYDRLEVVNFSDNTNVQIDDSTTKGLEAIGTDGFFKPIHSYTEKENILDAKGNKISIAKDVFGYVTTITDAKNRVQKISRDVRGRPIEISDVDSSISQIKYDEVFGDVIESKNVTLDITTKSTYSAYGQVLTQTDPYNKTSTNEYNNKLQIIKQTAPDGKYVTYEYNNLSLVTKKASYSNTNELKNQIIFEYNAKGQLVKQTDLNNKFSTYAYDASGNVITSTSNINASTQSITSYEYDIMNRLIKVTSPKAEVTEYTYSVAGELLEIKDPQNKITSFEYNTKGELIKKTDPLGQIHEMTYDKNGNLLTEKDPANQLKTYAYNEVNKITQVQTADDLISYQYNIKDEVLNIQNSTSAITYTRDQKQRIIQEVVSGTNYPSHTINIDYAKNDIRTQIQSNYQNISYSYNQDTYQMLGLSSSATGSYGFNYDDANRLSQVSRPGSVTNYTFDVGSNLSKISHLKNSTEITFHEYSYDLRNYITQKRSPASALNYSYDTNGQLISSNKPEDNSQDESFSYDALGNRLTYNGVTSTFDNSGQRIQDDGQYIYVYDLNGNIIYKSSKVNGVSYTFEYSALNQLKKAVVTSSPLTGNILKVLEYKYDPVGRRITRTLVDNTNSNKNSTKKYYYDGDNILAELDADNNLTASYTQSPLRPDDMLGVKFTAFAANSAISEGQVLTSSAGYAYYLKDHLNTVNEITNANGDVIQKMSYSSFGVLKSVKNNLDEEVGFENAPIKTSFTYTGREYEPELNMYYYRARYYDASTGRFLQIDPDPGKLSVPKSFLSKYSYVDNNPINMKDPSGQSWLSDLFGYLGVAIIGVVDITWGIVTLDIARVLTGVAMIVEFMLAPINLLLNGRLPKYSLFQNDAHVVDNSLLAVIFDNVPAFSLGAGMFVRYEADAEKLSNTKKHEYGHTLQYNEWGGWKYLQIGFEQKGICGSYLEDDADARAKKRFPGFLPVYGGCH